MKKIIFLPHCLRNKDCKAKLSDDGYLCINCGKCQIGKFKNIAEQKGYSIFIVPGGSMIKKIIKKFDKIDSVIGVACETELREGIQLLKKAGIKGKSLKLSKDGCVNTEVDFEKLYRMI